MKAYKLFRVKSGALFPLYVLSDKEVPIGQWIPAECGELTENGKVKDITDLPQKPNVKRIEEFVSAVNRAVVVSG